MNDESLRIYRLLGKIFTWTGAGILALFGTISIMAGLLTFMISLMTGLPFLLIGLGFLAFVRKKEKEVNEIIEMGHTVTAVITDFYQDTSITVNGRHPWIVEAVCDDPGTLGYYTFTAHTDGWRPSRTMIGANVSVFVDPLDYSRYAVDLDTIELPEEEDLSDVLSGRSEEQTFLQKR